MGVSSLPPTTPSTPSGPAHRAGGIVDSPALVATTAITARRMVVRLLQDAGCSLTGERVLLLCSGGVDSVTMVELLATLPRGARPEALVVLFMDHGLRDVAADRAAARGIAARHGLEFVERSASGLAGANVQARARAWRYRVASEVAQAAGCGIAATGHNADDQVETLLYGLVASSGVRALRGMPVVRRHEGVAGGACEPTLHLVRPLLALSRRAIVEVAQAQGLGWAEDPSNAGRRFQRNRLRHDVVPGLLEAHPGAGANLARTQRLLAGTSAAIDGLAAELLATACDDRGGLAVELLGRLPGAARDELIAAWLRACGLGRGVTQRSIAQVSALVALDAPSALAAAGGEPGGAESASAAGSYGPSAQLDGACVRRDRYHVRIASDQAARLVPDDDAHEE